MQFVDNMQSAIRQTSSSLLLFFFKLATGLMLGLTLSLALQQAFSYGNFLFLFVIVISSAAFLRIAKNWSWSTLLIFDLICVLVGLLLRMYVLIAPGT